MCSKEVQHIINNFVINTDIYIKIKKQTNKYDMKNNKINPIGLKGNEINERMRELMGIKPINENKSTSVVELSKIGPDGKSYAIVRENHEYFIKVSEKTSNLLSEDFKYIGGLQNKKSEAYPSYAKAIKHLNLNFKSLAEAYGRGGDINVFENDNLITESGVAGFSQYGGNGFSNEGNMEHNTPMFEEEGEDKNNPWAICTASVGREDKEKYEACVRDVKKEKGISEDVQMSEAEQAIDKMLEEDELVGNQGELDVDKDGDIEADDLADLRASKKVDEHHLSIARAMDNLDAIIEGLSVKKKV
jgi:hypothetical protein